MYQIIAFFPQVWIPILGMPQRTRKELIVELMQEIPEKRMRSFILFSANLQQLKIKIYQITKPKRIHPIVFSLLMMALIKSERFSIIQIIVVILNIRSILFFSNFPYLFSNSFDLKLRVVKLKILNEFPESSQNEQRQ